MLYPWAALDYGGDVVPSAFSRARRPLLGGAVILAALIVLAGVLVVMFPLHASAATRYTFTHSKTITTAANGGDRLTAPAAMAADVAGNVLFVLDSGRNRIVRYNLTTGAYLGVITGGFNNPKGIAFQPSPAGVTNGARILVTDSGNNRLVLMSTTGTVRDTLNYGVNAPTGVVWSTLASRFYVLNAGAREVRTYQSTSNNGNNQLKFISTFSGTTAAGSVISTNAGGINVQTDGTIVIADTGNNRVLHFSSTGTYIGKFGAISASPATGDGTLNAPRGVGSRSDGYLPVVDSGNHRVQVFESSAGGQVVAELGQAGVSGTGTDQLNSPGAALTVGTDVAIIADTGNNRIMYFGITKSVDEKPRIPINYDGLNCTDCHSDDLRIEHGARARGCVSCHRISSTTGKPDYTTMATRIAGDLEAQGLTDSGSCGSNTRYCHSAEAKNPTTGVSRAIHGMDGYQVQQAHKTIEADGTHSPMNACSGTTGGCHSDQSTESPFWFGGHDPASAKSDYSYHQARGSAGTDYATSDADTVGTVDITTLEHPCMACHDQPSGRSFGEREKAEALAKGEAWTCSTTGCHDMSGKSGVYAQAQCYRTPNWDTLAFESSSLMSGGTSSTADDAAMDGLSVSAFYQPLLDLVLGGGEPESADVTVLTDALELPGSSTPATRPISLEYMLMGTQMGSF